MKSLLAFIRKNRWMLLLALIGVLLIRWRMQHGSSERLINVPDGSLLAIQNGQLLINQESPYRLDLISVNAFTGAKRSLRREQNRLALFLDQRVGISNFLMDGPWLTYPVLSGSPQFVARTDGQRALQIPPLILRRVHAQNGITEDLLQFTCGDAYAQMNFDPKLVVVSTPPLRLIDNALYWIAPLPTVPAAPRLLVEGLNTPRPRMFGLMRKPLDNTPARPVITGLSNEQLNFAVQGDRLYWTDGSWDDDQYRKNSIQLIHGTGHTTLWTRRLPDGPVQRLASGLHRGLLLTPTSYGLYVEETLPSPYLGLMTKRLLYFDLDNRFRTFTFPKPINIQNDPFAPMTFRGRIYVPVSIDTDIPRLKGVRMGRLLSMKPDGSDQKQLFPASNPIVVKMEAPVVYRGRLYVTAEVKKSYYDGLAPVPLLTQLEETPAEHLQPLPRASEVAGTYFDGDYCYFVKSEERRSWRNWLDDTQMIPIQKVLYRYRLPDRRKSR